MPGHTMPQLEEKAAPRLFISYSHDSREHEDGVLALADRLRHDGIDALIDQYNTAPPDGWPMWMDREIQKADFVAMVCTETYLRRVEGRELPGKGRGVLWEAKLIYNSIYSEDSTVQRFIPVLFAGGQSSYIPLPIRGSTYYQVDSAEGYEEFYRHLTGQPRHVKPTVGKLKALTAIAPQSYPASLEIGKERRLPTSLDQQNRRQMLKGVRFQWIDGVLRRSLYQIARIEFGLQVKFDAVEQPLKTIVQTPDRPLKDVTGVPIGQLFDDHAGALLILGLPGTGKTTLLLELAQDLLDRAEQDESLPIPVVFNLSSWAVHRPPLSRWLEDELNKRSYVPNEVAQQWLETEQILPLLDGLDEVALDHRQACAEAINNFRRDHGLLPIAICSRIGDYEALGTKLRLQSAVVVQPLTRIEVQGYLERLPEPAHQLRAALKANTSLWELIETPLMLWVAMLAYRDAPVEIAVEDSFEQRRKRLFAKFVEAMFERRSAESGYTQHHTVSWLCWLARTLTRDEQTTFYLEILREEWLPSRWERWLSKAGTILTCSVIGGLIGCPVFGTGAALIPSFDWVLFGLYIGLICGLVAGLVVTFTKFRNAEILRFSFSNLRSRIGRAIRDGLALGMLGVLTSELIFAPRGGWTMGLYIGLCVGLSVGLVKLVTTNAVDPIMRPNQGTRDSIKNAFLTLLSIVPAFGLTTALLVGLDWGRDLLDSFLRLALGLGFGLVGGLIGGFWGGGLFAIRHWVLRLALWMRGSAPLNYVPFLDYSVERLFLRKVGGGYIFLHRMLQEYFATLAEPSGHPDKDLRASAR